MGFLQFLASLFKPRAAPPFPLKPVVEVIRKPDLPVLTYGRFPAAGMSMSRDGKDRLLAREGIRTEAYQDSNGTWTIGVGHTSGAYPGQIITEQEARDMFDQDVEIYAAPVRERVRVTLKQCEFDALVSFVFNIGPTSFTDEKCTALRRLNAGDYAEAASSLLMWNKPQAIIGRRQSEINQFLGK